MWFCDAIFMTLFSRYRYKLMSKFPVNSEFAFESYACFIVLHLLPISVIYFLKQMNLQEKFAHIHFVPKDVYRCKSLHFFGQKMGGGGWGCGSPNGPLSETKVPCKWLIIHILNENDQSWYDFKNKALFWWYSISKHYLVQSRECLKCRLLP